MERNTLVKSAMLEHDLRLMRARGLASMIECMAEQAPRQNNEMWKEIDRNWKRFSKDLGHMLVEHGAWYHLQMLADLNRSVVSAEDDLDGVRQMVQTLIDGLE